MRGFQRTFVGTFVGVWLVATSANAITINLNYKDTTGSFHPDAVRAFTAQEIAVIDQAKAYWQGAIASGETFNVDVVLANLTPGRLGEARPGGSGMGTPIGGTILFDDRVGPETLFFVDPTPAANGEYPVTGFPATRLLADAISPALGLFDFLTVAEHEFGHILGISSFYASFANNVINSLVPPDPSALPVYVFQGAPALGNPADYLAGFAFTNGGVYLDQNEEDAGEGGSVGGKPSHLGDTFAGGVSAGLFLEDLMNESLGTGERLLIADVDLDILEDAYGYTVVPEPSSLALLGAALLVLVGLTRFRSPV